MSEILDEPAPGHRATLEDIDAAAERVIAADGAHGWRRSIELQLGPKRWRPTAVSHDGGRLLYVFLQDDFPRFVRERLELAVDLGIRVTIAVNIAALFREDIIALLVGIDADVLVLDDYVEVRQLQPRAILTALADIEVPLPPESRRLLAESVWNHLQEGSANEKGRRLEGLLAFLFAQVGDLKVVERNCRNASEEIDLVLQVDNYSPRVWQKSGVPFILVEAKNRVDKATQQVVSALITKLQTKRGTSKIAILVSLAGFTEDARIQELRFSTQDLCVVMIDKVGLKHLLFADDLDDALEEVVRRSLLR